MSANPASINPAVPQSAPVRPGPVIARTVIRGRITGRRKSGQSFLTLITMPAPSEWESPSTVEVRSSQPLGEPDEVVTVHCAVSGYKRQFNDKDTGAKVNTADVRLTAVE